jgi:hypothetical protein
MPNSHDEAAGLFDAYLERAAEADCSASAAQAAQTAA